MRVEPQLFALVFGESVLNDAVAIVIYEYVFFFFFAKSEPNLTNVIYT